MNFYYVALTRCNSDILGTHYPSTFAPVAIRSGGNWCFVLIWILFLFKLTVVSLVQGGQTPPLELLWNSPDGREKSRWLNTCCKKSVALEEVFISSQARYWEGQERRWEWEKISLPLLQKDLRINYFFKNLKTLSITSGGTPTEWRCLIITAYNKSSH